MHPKGTTSRIEQRARSMIGQKFGWLTVVDVSRYRLRTQAMVMCRCDCGGMRDVVLYALRKGAVKSCGCRSRWGPRKATRIAQSKLTDVIALAGDWAVVYRRWDNVRAEQP